MPAQYSAKYVERLIDENDYHSLLLLVEAFCKLPAYDDSCPDFGLPPVAFVLTEGIEWIAAALRSGMVTYYEVCPLARQRAMVAALGKFRAGRFSQWYERGVKGWKDQVKRNRLDELIQTNDDTLIDRLHSIAKQDRRAILRLISR